jgi:hypothetical protein
MFVGKKRGVMVKDDDDDEVVNPDEKTQCD